MRLAVGLLFAILIATARGSAQTKTAAPPRRAFLIDSSAYEHLPPLTTPRANVEALKATLSKAHFQVEVGYDLSQGGMVSAIRNFMGTIQQGDFVLVYFSGYGYQADGLNYLLPVSFDPKDETALGQRAYSVRYLQSQLEQRKAGTRMLVFDASRPCLGLPRGLAIMASASNTLALFSAAPNRAAPDPAMGGMNAFTSSLVSAIETPGLTLLGVLDRVQEEMKRVSSGEQVPFSTRAAVEGFSFTLPRGAPVIEQISSEPSYIQRGQTSTLRWKVTGEVTNVSIDHGVGTVTDSGSLRVNPAEPVTYTLTATGPGGQSRAWAMVTVTNPPPAPPPPGGGAAKSDGPIWPAPGGTRWHSGFSPIPGPRRPRIAWSLELDHAPLAPLIGGDSTVYFLGFNNQRDFILTSVRNGLIVWSVPFEPAAPNYLEAATLTPQGLIKVLTTSGVRFVKPNGQMAPTPTDSVQPPPSSVSRDGKLYFFMAGQNELRRSDDSAWRVELEGSAHNAPSLDDSGSIYVVGAIPDGEGRRFTGRLYAISEKGQILWTYSTPKAITTTASTTPQGDVLFGSGDDALYCVRGGQLRWKFQTAGAVGSPPIHDRTGTIFFGSGGGNFYAVDNAGRQVWRIGLGSGFPVSAAIDRVGRLYVSVWNKTGNKKSLDCLEDLDPR